MSFTESYRKSDAKVKDIDFRTLPDYLKQHAVSKPNGEAFVFASVNEPWQRITWNELYQKSCAAASGLVNLGLKPGEIVAINLPVCPEWLYASYGTMMAGAIPCGVSFTYVDGSDLVAMMERLRTCSFLILDSGINGVKWNIARKQLDAFGPDGTAKSSTMPYLRCLVRCGEGVDQDWANVKSFENVLKSDCSVDLPPISTKDTLGLFQTSGSTGIPKLIPYTHEIVALAALGGFEHLFKENEPFLNDRPFNWVGGYTYSVVTGQTRVTVSGFSAVPENYMQFIIDVVTKEKCEVLFALPGMLEELKQLQHSLPTDWPLKKIMTGGQPLTARVAEAVGTVCETLYCIYGLSECFALAEAAVTDKAQFVEYGCGRPLSVNGLEIKILDEAGKIVPVNERGEIFGRSPMSCNGYFNDEEKTKKVFTADGWYRTDDIGRMSSSGELFVEGRKSNMIISGGFNVAPEIMEMAMRKVRGVKEVVIVPIPDAVLYQVLCACVQKDPDVDCTDDEIRQYCSDYHADRRGLFTVLPKFYMFVEKFPLLSTGKIDRKQTTTLAQARFSSAS